MENCALPIGWGSLCVGELGMQVEGRMWSSVVGSRHPLWQNSNLYKLNIKQQVALGAMNLLSSDMNVWLAANSQDL